MGGTSWAMTATLVGLDHGRDVLGDDGNDELLLVKNLLNVRQILAAGGCRDTSHGCEQENGQSLQYCFQDPFSPSMPSV
jgi:hypothetical protein